MNKKLISLNICFLSIISGYSQEKKTNFITKVVLKLAKINF